MIIGSENPDKFRKLNVENTGMNERENVKIDIGIISDDQQKSDDI